MYNVLFFFLNLLRVGCLFTLKSFSIDFPMTRFYSVTKKNKMMSFAGKLCN